MNKNRIIAFFSFLVFLMVLIFFMHRFLLKQMPVRKKNVRTQESQKQLSSEPEEESSYPQDEQIVPYREERIDPGRKYVESVIYVDGEQAARFKSRNYEIYDLEGNIPNGKIEFANPAAGFYGEEYFSGNQRHGLYKEFYKTGALRKEITFFDGKVVYLKEYFIDGRLRMSVDYSHALVGLGEDEETGDGKLYSRDGVLMYEWHMVTMDQNLYKKSYNRSGALVSTELFDANGKYLKTIGPGENTLAE